MRTIGIIAEYNPFHKGHAYHIQKSKDMTGAKQVIAVMSGSFVQRGEPALFDKFLRTEAALKNGVDLVLELPVIFACATAEIFATGGIRLLTETGLVEGVCFGSECGDLPLLEEAARLMENETEEFRRLLKEALEEGLSYPAARAKAMQTISHTAAGVLSTPNDILALEYLKALHRTGSPLKPVAIKREGDYHNTELSTAGFASASALRAAFLEGNHNEALSHIPQNAVDIFSKALSLGQAPVRLSGFTDALQYKLRTTSAEELSHIADVTEGLENRMLSAMEQAWEMDELIQLIKTKRYTQSRIRRILIHTLLDITAKEQSYFLSLRRLPYLRVLGFRKESADLLGELTERSNCPVLSNLKKAPELLDEDGRHLLALEKLATDLHKMAVPMPIYRAPHTDFTHPLVIV